jgi:hypothetical protein
MTCHMVPGAECPGRNWQNAGWVHPELRLQARRDARDEAITRPQSGWRCCVCKLLTRRDSATISFREYLWRREKCERWMRFADYEACVEGSARFNCFAKVGQRGLLRSAYACARRKKKIAG